MGVHNNFPVDTWIKLDGISVKKGDKIHIVKDFKTNLKYIYWNEETPDKLTASNVMLGNTATRFLIVTNNKGECIQVPQTDIVVAFDGNSVEALQDYIWGLHEKDTEFGSKFVSVEQDINGIRQTVGQVQEDLGSAKENISKVEQSATEINLSVKELDRKFNDNKELLELRENVNMSIINLNSTLGLFKSKISEYFKDRKISEDEKVEIQTHIGVLHSKRDACFIEVDKVIELMEKQDHSDKVLAVTSGKTKLNNAIDNLVTLINTSISDNVIVPSEITLVTDAFAKTNVAINELKNTIDEAIFLGTGGVVSEKLAGIDIKADEIELKVSETVEKADSIDKKYSEILLSPDGIVNKVENVQTTVTEQGKTIESTKSEIKQMAGSIDLAVSVANTANGNATDAKSQVSILAGEITNKVSVGEVGSIIRQSPNDIKIGFNDISDSVVINSSGLTVNQGYIACDTLTTPSGHDPIVKLFPNNGSYCSIDATRQYESGGRGDWIRLKWDSSNYWYVGKNSAGVYLNNPTNESDGEYASQFWVSTTHSRLRANKLMIGRDNCRIDTTGGYFRLYTSPDGSIDRGIMISPNSGRLSIRNDGVYFAKLNSSGGVDTEIPLGGSSNVSWGDISGKPSYFPPSSHSHSEYASSSHSHSQYYGWGYDAEFNSCMPTRHNGNQQYCGTVAQAWSYVCCYNLRYNNFGTNVSSYALKAGEDTIDGAEKQKEVVKNFFKRYTELSQEVPTSPLIGSNLKPFTPNMSTKAGDASSEDVDVTNIAPSENKEFTYNEVFVMNENGESFVDGAKMSQFQSQCLEVLVNENATLTERVTTLESEVKELKEMIKQLIK